MGILRPFLNWTGPPEPLQKGKMAGGGVLGVIDLAKVLEAEERRKSEERGRGNKKIR